jgi:hypothetical protein
LVFVSQLFFDLFHFILCDIYNPSMARLIFSADAENGSGGHISDLEFAGGSIGICRFLKVYVLIYLDQIKF